MHIWMMLKSVYLRYICSKKLFIQNVSFIFHKINSNSTWWLFFLTKIQLLFFLQVLNSMYMLPVARIFRVFISKKTIHTCTIHWMVFMFFIYCTEKKFFIVWSFLLQENKNYFPFIALQGHKFKWFRCFTTPLHVYEHFLIVSGYFWSRLSQK